MHRGGCNRLRILPAAWLVGLTLSACTVGPEFVPPEPEAPPDWSRPAAEGISNDPASLVAWWTVFDDPVLDELVETAIRSNNTLEITALRVLEARSQLGIATGSAYPQTQVASGDATYVSPPDNSGVDSGYWSYALGAGVAWEIDFWGRFRRGIESADAA